jgi:hypothetical protein
MNLKRGKKGFSRILIASLIILVFLITVGILFITIRSFMQGGSVPLGKSVLNLKIEKAQLVDNNLSLTVKRNPGGGDFAGLNFMIEDGKDSEKFTKDISMNEFEMRTFTFTLKEINPDNLQTITIFPIFKLKSGRKITSDAGYLWESSSEIYRCTTDCKGKTCGDNGCGGTCGDCTNEHACHVNGTCIPSDACIDTCASLKYQCGIVCGIDCGNCTNHHGTTSCLNGQCNPICYDDYSDCDLNAINGCETQLGTNFNCASCGNNCSTGDVCTNHICAPPCTDTCNSLNYNCGIQTICGRKILCGVCPSEFNCQINGTCIK